MQIKVRRTEVYGLQLQFYLLQFSLARPRFSLKLRHCMESFSPWRSNVVLLYASSFANMLLGINMFLCWQIAEPPNAADIRWLRFMTGLMLSTAQLYKYIKNGESLLVLQAHHLKHKNYMIHVLILCMKYLFRKMGVIQLLERLHYFMAC